MSSVAKSLALAAAASLMLAQPAGAAVRSADSLPAVSVSMSAVQSRYYDEDLDLCIRTDDDGVITRTEGHCPGKAWLPYVLGGLIVALIIAVVAGDADEDSPG